MGESAHIVQQRERLVVIQDVAEHLGISVSGVRRAVREEGLPSVMIGSLRKFRLSDVDALIDAEYDGPVR